MANKGSLSDTIQKMIDDIDRAGAIAGLLLKDEVHNDFEKAAKTSVDNYYKYVNGYYTKYERQYRLYKTYDVKTSIAREGNNIVISTGIYMDSDPLEGLYHSNSSRHQGSGSWESGGDVEAEYVFKNFISGKHPWTNGWPWSNSNNSMYGQLQYELISSRPSPDNYLKRYRDRYVGVYFNKHVQNMMEKLLKVYA